VAKLEHPWCERNKKPILEVFRRVLPEKGTVLEVGSGSGQHAAFFAQHLPGLDWLPSDIEDENLESIRAWRAEAARPNLLDPVRLDVVADRWPVDQVDVVFSANMVHITPWDCCLGLLAGARRHLEQDGLLIMYGPFRIGGEHTAQSNEEFDASLRDRDSRWGVRDLGAIRDAGVGLEFEDRFEMPANNQILVFRRKIELVPE
jgi:SAM-dependent methyltransferase